MRPRPPNGSALLSCELGGGRGARSCTVRGSARAVCGRAKVERYMFKCMDCKRSRSSDSWRAALLCYFLAFVLRRTTCRSSVSRLVRHLFRKGRSGMHAGIPCMIRLRQARPTGAACRRARRDSRGADDPKPSGVRWPLRSVHTALDGRRRSVRHRGWVPAPEAWPTRPLCFIWPGGR